MEDASAATFKVSFDAKQPANLHRASAARHTGRLASVLSAARREGSLVAGAALLSVIFTLALVAPYAFPGDPLAITGPSFLWPGEAAGHSLGTDALGRDVAAGIAHGARFSLFVGMGAAFLSTLAGVTAGAVAGFFGGWADRSFVRVTEIFQTIPGFLLLMVLMEIVPPSLFSITGTIALVSWPMMARVARTEFMALRSREFVLAARTLGYGPARIIVMEILPNALPPIIAIASVSVASAILMEAALAFMGLGDPNTVSWGLMIGNGREFLRTAWYLSAIPGGAIMATVLGFNLLADGLARYLDPHRADRASARTP
ncbi:MAG: ABC transporter permease [Acetobacter sp.]